MAAWWLRHARSSRTSRRNHAAAVAGSRNMVQLVPPSSVPSTKGLGPAMAPNQTCVESMIWIDPGSGAGTSSVLIGDQVPPASELVACTPEPIHHQLSASMYANAPRLAGVENGF